MICCSAGRNIFGNTDTNNWVDASMASKEEVWQITNQYAARKKDNTLEKNMRQHSFSINGFDKKRHLLFCCVITLHNNITGYQNTCVSETRSNDPSSLLLHKCWSFSLCYIDRRYCQRVKRLQNTKGRIIFQGFKVDHFSSLVSRKHSEKLPYRVVHYSLTEMY